MHLKPNERYLLIFLFMATLTLRNCSAVLQEAVQQPLEPEEEDGILAGISSTLEMMEDWKEKIGERRKAWELVVRREARSTSTGYRLVTVESNLKKIFLTEQADGSTADIARNLRTLSSQNPVLVMAFAYTMYSGDWNKDDMSLEKHNLVMQLLKPVTFEEELVGKLKELLEKLREGALKDSREFGVFHGSHPALNLHRTGTDAKRQITLDFPEVWEASHKMQGCQQRRLRS